MGLTWLILVDILYDHSTGVNPEKSLKISPQKYVNCKQTFQI